MIFSCSGKNPTLLVQPNIWKWDSKTHQTATSNVWKLSATGGSSIKLSNADGNTQMESPFLVEPAQERAASKRV